MTDLRQGVAPITHEVLDEIERAIAKFPTWPTDPLHALAVLGEEFGELTKAVLQSVYEPHKSTPADVRAEAIQTAAMALRFLHSRDRYSYQPGAQHVQAVDGDPGNDLPAGDGSEAHLLASQIERAAKALYEHWRDEIELLAWPSVCPATAPWEKLQDKHTWRTRARIAFGLPAEPPAKVPA
jgi:hypothetical protein